jgi:hypothetical protein
LTGRVVNGDNPLLRIITPAHRFQQHAPPPFPKVDELFLQYRDAVVEPVSRLRLARFTKRQVQYLIAPSSIGEPPPVSILHSAE